MAAVESVGKEQGCWVGGQMRAWTGLSFRGWIAHMALRRGCSRYLINGISMY
jgi:hypothetical protein